MNKLNRYFIVLNMLAFIWVIGSCVNDDFKLPNISINEPDISLNNITTFRAIISRLEQAQAKGELVAVIDEETDLYIEGYVISSDRAGNFFEELIIQNKTDASNPDEDPRLGFKIEVNVSSLSDTYEVGRKVYVKMNGLTVGASNGVIVIGAGDGKQVDQIQAYQYKDVIIRSTEMATLTPKVTTIEGLSEGDENTLIQLDNIQINRHELAFTYAGEKGDEFDGFRTLESCDTHLSILLQTSTFSDFKSVQVPQNKGSMQGVFTRDFGDAYNVLIINSTKSINFEDPARCDPEELDCGLASTIGTGNLFNENFQSQTNNKLITGNGWTNYIESGTEGWEAYTATGTNASLGRSARVGSYASGDIVNIAWLISPAINLDVQNGETLVFKTSNSFADGSTMEVLYSTDWDGTEANILSANWGVLSAAYVTQDSDYFGNWLSSGNVDLSCANGTMYIAFKYRGNGQEDFDGSYELDDISIDYVP